MSVGHFAGDPVVFEDCAFGFIPTPSGFAAYPKAFIASSGPPQFRNCSLATQDGNSGETLYFAGVAALSNMGLGNGLGADTDPTWKLWQIGGLTVPGHMSENFVRSSSQDPRDARIDGVTTRLRYIETALDQIEAPIGGGFLSTTLDNAPILRWIDSAAGQINPGVLNVTVNSDGTGEITGANLDRVFAVGDICEWYGVYLTNVVDGNPAENVAVCLGRVDTVAPGTVTLKHVPTYVCDAYAGLGAQAMNVFIYPVRRIHTPTTGTVDVQAVNATTAPR
jgi:hypothetical protein